MAAPMRKKEGDKIGRLRGDKGEVMDSDKGEVMDSIGTLKTHPPAAKI